MPTAGGRDAPTRRCRTSAGARPRSQPGHRRTSGITRVVASPLRRAHETATIIAAGPRTRGARRRPAPGARRGRVDGPDPHRDRGRMARASSPTVAGPRASSPTTCCTTGRSPAIHEIAAVAPEPVIVVSHGGLIRVVERALGSEPHSVPNLGGLEIRSGARGPGAGRAHGADRSGRRDGHRAARGLTSDPTAGTTARVHRRGCRARVDPWRRRSASTAFSFPIAPDALWTRPGAHRRIPGWWSWLREFDADGLRAGSTARCTIQSPLPYALHCRIRVDELVPPRTPGSGGAPASGLVAATIAGDLRGPARLEVAGDGPGSIARLVWSLHIGNPVLGGLARVARPLMTSRTTWSSGPGWSSSGAARSPRPVAAARSRSHAPAAVADRPGTPGDGSSRLFGSPWCGAICVAIPTRPRDRRRAGLPRRGLRPPGGDAVVGLLGRRGLRGRAPRRNAPGAARTGHRGRDHPAAARRARHRRHPALLRAARPRRRPTLLRGPAGGRRRRAHPVGGRLAGARRRAVLPGDRDLAGWACCAAATS